MRGDRKAPPIEPETDPSAERKAVALKYDQERDHAPRVTAKGRGYVAENILAAAQKNAVPVYQNKTIVNMLMALELDRDQLEDYAARNGVSDEEAEKELEPVLGYNRS